MGAIEEAQAYLDARQDPQTLTDEELIRRLPDEALLQVIQARQAQAEPEALPVEPLGPIARQPIFQTLVGRPAAQYRSFIRGLAPGGETPLQGLQRGALAQGAELAQRARGFDIQRPLIERYYQALAERNPGQYPNFSQRIGGFLPSAVGLAAEIGANIATSPLELATALAPFTRAGKAGTEAIAASRPGQVIGQFLTKERSFRRPPLDVPRLLQTPEAKVGKLPPAIRDLYLRERRAQLSRQMQVAGQDITTVSHEAKIELNRLNRETLANLREDTQRLERQLKDTAYQVALKLKTTDIGPTLTAQSTRYGEVVNSVIDEAATVRFTPKRLIAALERDFADDPRAFNIAFDELKLNVVDEYGQTLQQAFSPREVLNEIDRIGLTIPRSHTQSYTFTDSVKDRLRDTLLKEIELEGKVLGRDFTKIREAKAEWAQWKPVQKRLLSGTRYFEQSETVTDAFVSKLMQFARTDRTMNNEKYFEEIARYIGRDFAKPMRPIIAKLTAVERQTLAAEAAKFAEIERIGVQTQAARQQLTTTAQAGQQSIANLEVRLTEQAERAKRFWGLLGKLGLLGGGVYGLNELRKLVR